MKSPISGLIIGFIVTFVANALLAMSVIGPLLNQRLGISRTMEQGLHFPSMIFGYLGLAAFMVWQIRRRPDHGWLRQGIIVGGTSGLVVFVAGHAIVAGWSVADPLAMILAGLVDTLAAIIGACAITFAQRK